jgi:uncharacterized membrane protein
MPYSWSEDSAPDQAELHLWPHKSMTAEGFAGFILGTFVLAAVPLIWMVGTVIFWGILPFMLIALGGVYYALRRSNRDRHILEVLTLTPERTRLTRHNPDGSDQDWEDNTYWVRVACHETGGPVPYYVTLKGTAREVEIGAFLSEDERRALFAELDMRMRNLASA